MLEYVQPEPEAGQSPTAVERILPGPGAKGPPNGKSSTAIGRAR